ncbi:MAG TPA: protein disulfide oxidoreductase [Mycobacterium sp.]|uniref:protein disulfide oxidoreductase n=1 Tax=Mycobacterium sp. TaxID=1785 RepID=UPI002CD66708|nr:protein disulfide oxidoreductase [Mycobacterium sp.]HME79239.1 protein disulfide oxidoreductase [Mycobacterium sp.]
MTLARLIACLAVVAAVVAACGSQSGSQLTRGHSAPAAVSPTTGQIVPAQLQFTAKTLDGHDFSGQGLLGKPAVLWFWAPWCPVCQREAPAVGQIAAAHPAVTFVGVAGLDMDTAPAMQEFVSKYPVNGFTELADTDGVVWAKFGVTRQPAYAFIRPDGGIDVVKQPLSDADLSQRVTALVNP